MTQGQNRALDKFAAISSGQGIMGNALAAQIGQRANFFAVGNAFAGQGLINPFQQGSGFGGQTSSFLQQFGGQPGSRGRAQQFGQTSTAGQPRFDEEIGLLSPERLAELQQFGIGGQGQGPGIGAASRFSNVTGL